MSNRANWKDRAVAPLWVRQTINFFICVSVIIAIGLFGGLVGGV